VSGTYVLQGFIIVLLDFSTFLSEQFIHFLISLFEIRNYLFKVRPWPQVLKLSLQLRHLPLVLGSGEAETQVGFGIKLLDACQLSLRFA
jgi:hypothetical protein